MSAYGTQLCHFNGCLERPQHRLINIERHRMCMLNKLANYTGIISCMHIVGSVGQQHSSTAPFNVMLHTKHTGICLTARDRHLKLAWMHSAQWDGAFAVVVAAAAARAGRWPPLAFDINDVLVLIRDTFLPYLCMKFQMPFSPNAFS